MGLGFTVSCIERGFQKNRGYKFFVIIATVVKEAPTLVLIRRRKMGRYVSSIKKLHLNGARVLHDRSLSDAQITTLERIGGNLVHKRCGKILAFRFKRFTPEGDESVYRCSKCWETVYVPDIIWSRIPFPKDALWA